MSATKALKAARTAGISVGIEGDDLVLEAETAPPSAVLDLLSLHKTDIIALLRRNETTWTQQDWDGFFQERAAIIEYDGGLDRANAALNAFEETVDHWLAINPPMSTSNNNCLKCGEAALPDQTETLKIALAGGRVGLLHARCGSAWQQHRRATARSQLKFLLSKDWGFAK